jgi:hypothetical protein
MQYGDNHSIDGNHNTNKQSCTRLSGGARV